MATEPALIGSVQSRFASGKDSHLVYLCFIERAYNRPPQDSPVIVSPAEAAANHNTLCVVTEKKTCPAKNILKSLKIKSLLGYSTQLGWRHDQTFVFQESENAPAASKFPPPENDDDPKLRPKYRVLDWPCTVPVGTIDKVINAFGISSRDELPCWVDTNAMGDNSSKGSGDAGGNTGRKKPSATKRAREE